ncbi:hypothetical protein OS493_019267 [Desmophyllum pertusum]|uniref:Uncharacterized protein n=1 Tax=Desmophyllum pertusum TaxID=174260 RepID=A0A9X0CE50_9CNID|nr:hypothetical protein OS493_019267 [Desmophyllum pertusum]
MSYVIGNKCEGLHDGRWFICTILSSEDEGYKVSFDGWSRRFDAVLTADCIRPRSTIDCRSRKRYRPSVNFHKLLADDEVCIDVEGIRKTAVVRVVDPILELLTVECGNKEVTVAFHDILLPEEPTPTPVKKRKPAASPQVTPLPAGTAPLPEPISAPSTVAPQFASIVRLDGTEISCGDLVNLSSNSPDLMFVVLELYKEGTGDDILLKAQKCDLSEGVAVHVSTNFSLTCPVSAVHKLLGAKLSSSMKKALLDIRHKSIVRVSQSLQLHVGNRSYQLQARRYQLASKLRCEIQKAISSKAARSVTIKLGPADLHHDFELLGLSIGNSFRVGKSKDHLADLDPLLGEKWDVKLKQDDRFFYVTFTEFAMEVSSRSLLARIKFAESTCAFRQDSYRNDTAADCC